MGQERIPIRGFLRGIIMEFPSVDSRVTSSTDLQRSDEEARL